MSSFVQRCFLFTDIEGSTGLWERHGHCFRIAQDLHNAILRAAIREHGGQELMEAGDGFLVAFEDALHAAACAVAAQQGLAGAEWPNDIGPLAVRMGLHAGDVEPRENGEYRGIVLNRAARVRDAAHGGQILCSETVAAALGAAFETRDRGLFRLRGMPSPERLCQIGWSGMPRADFPPPNATPAYTHSVPALPTRFVGRKNEIAKIRDLFSGPASRNAGGPRLVTLTGPGGTGKTRVAVAVAESLLVEFSHAVWFVPLADVLDPQLILPAVRDVIQSTSDQMQDPLDQITRHIGDQPALLVLDNFEQLAEQGATVVQALLSHLPALRCLITSRQRLHLGGEREFPIPSLSLPRSDAELEELREADSVALFADRAESVRPGFELTPRNAPAVAELCRRLDGAPLAIELAAARAGVMTPREIVDSLCAHLDQFSSTDPSAPARHRSLRAAIEWSYAYLPPALRRFFANLSIFRGGWTAAAAEAVAAPAGLTDISSHVPRALNELRSLSLMVAEERGDTMRFRMLETIRQYAEEQVPEEERPSLRERHLRFFQKLSRTAEKGMVAGGAHPRWLDLLEGDFDNIRFALSAPVKDDAPVRIATALGLFWLIRGHAAEGIHWLSHLLEAYPDADPLERAAANYLVGVLLENTHGLDRARAAYGQALKYFRGINDRKNIAGTLNNLGNLARKEGELDLAHKLYQEALGLSREVGDEGHVKAMLNSLATIYIRRGDYEAARAKFEEALQIERRSDDPWILANALTNFALVLRKIGDYRGARVALDEGTQLRLKIRDSSHLVSNLVEEALLAFAEGSPTNAAKYASAALWIKESAGGRSVASPHSELMENLDTIRGSLTPEAWRQAERDGVAFARQCLREIEAK